MKLAAWVAKPRTQVGFNGVLMAGWLAMVPVTLLVRPLRDAILYVALMSVWANFATHLGGWIAALVNVRAERIDNRTEQGVHFARIEEAEDRILAAIEGLRPTRAKPRVVRKAVRK